MNYEEQDYVSWNHDMMLEIVLSESNSFLKIRETLSRIGIPKINDKILYQSCHILHKRGKYYIVHFKELFALDHKPSTLSHRDIYRRNDITELLEQWGLCKIVNRDVIVNHEEHIPMKIIRYSEKSEWTLITKYKIGIHRNNVNESRKIDYD